MMDDETERGYGSDDHPVEPSVRTKINILWQEHIAAQRRRRDHIAQARLYAWYLGGAAAIASVVSTIMGLWPRVK